MSKELLAVSKIAKKNPDGVIARLNALIGADQTMLIVAEFSGQLIYFPRYSTLKRAMREGE